MPYPSDINDSWDQYYEDEKPVQSLFDPEEWDDEEFEEDEEKYYDSEGYYADEDW